MPEYAGGVVRLTVSDGPAQGTVHEFGGRATCLLGRSRDCDPRLPAEDDRVSRHHCLLDINPPDVRVRDFGSLNGTFVNGAEIGRRAPGQTPEQAARTAFPERDLHDGDELRIGRTTVRVTIVPAVPRMRPAPARSVDPVAGVPGYEVLSELGRGGQGVVHLAREHATGDLVALKILHPVVAATARAREQFLREITAIRDLRHPNIVRFRETGECGAAFYLVCDYCRHGSLDHLLERRGGTLPPDEAVAVTRQILDGLDHAHEHGGSGGGLVHRDVKPANILLAGLPGPGRAPVVRISDFGLAKAFDNAGLSGLTRTGDVAGTLAYMPRSQLVDYKYAKPEVDVWAAAATLYRMLTGTTPRNFPAGVDPIVVLLNKSAVSLRRRNRAVPRRLAQVIDEALVDRPQIAVTTAGEFRQRLDRAWPEEAS
ncbi:protein kinase domain-containing protein [Amycolatopsis ultiminotia]|uniref:protein kinase domain-containing protein n=1 Tax=Amycolatopsis ultiminotia TaxID=543629 RepID=UPI0031EC4E5B